MPRASRPRNIRRFAALALLACAIIGSSALVIVARSARPRPVALPMTMVWAWERPEDLRQIDPATVGVAFLAKTIQITPRGIVVRPRLQPLRVPAGTRLVSVVRIETTSDPDGARSWTPDEHVALVRDVVAAAVPDVIGVQIDFDARASERSAYANLIRDVRRALPDRTSLSITALASWCLDDRWLDRLPVSEAVPMLFRMGPDGADVRRRLAAGTDFRAAVCRQSVGVSTDEPAPRLRGAARRTYVFHPRAWSEQALRTIASAVSR